jgi:hypothetical protein
VESTSVSQNNKSINYGDTNRKKNKGNRSQNEWALNQIYRKLKGKPTKELRQVADALPGLAGFA